MTTGGDYWVTADSGPMVNSGRGEEHLRGCERRRGE